MTQIQHGAVLPLQPAADPKLRMSGIPPKSYYSPWTFDYMFPELQTSDKNFLETSKDVVNRLTRLGRDGMEDDEYQIPGVPTPAIYTFFTQFVDHDITFERGSRNIDLKDPKPIDREFLDNNIVNSRSPNLDLDNVYGPNLAGELSPRDPNNPDKMRIDEVITDETSQGLPPAKDIYNDLPRSSDGTALIGDPRDDQNVVLAQLHVAFLRAHNALVDTGLKFGEARKLLRQHYQWVVLDDFLERIADPNIVKRIRYHGPRFFSPSPRSFFMPLEFSVAAFRFGHSKVRSGYSDFNSLQPDATLRNLFTNAGTQLSSDWMIDWSAFLDSEDKFHFPRPIDPTLAEKLLKLDRPQIGPGDPEGNLAIRNLLRGYIFKLPTGQAVANAMASQGIAPLTPTQISSLALEPGYKKTIQTLTDCGFLESTPLWYYILAEATYYSRGHHLGPVGSTIVAEVLIGVLRNSSDSILCDPTWRPTLGRTPGKFDLEDLLRLAGVY